MTTGTGLWNELILNNYSLPYTLSDSPLTPGIPDYGFSFFYDGDAKGTCTVEDKRSKNHRLKFGMGQIIPPYTGIAWQWRSFGHARENVKAVSLYLAPNLFTRIAMQDLDLEPNNIEIPANVGFFDELMGRIALELKAEAENGLPCGRIYGETAAQFLAIHMLRRHGSIRRLPEYKGGLSIKHLKRVEEYIDAYLDRDISLHAMARLCGLSSFHFIRLFKASTGISPHQYVIKRRIEKARLLLEYTRMSILHVALEVGYENHSHFSQIFKKTVGCSPREYRGRIA